MNNKIIEFPENTDQPPESPALILIKNAIDNLSNEETNALFHYLRSMDYPLSE
ncbi:MAG: hypothetical protein PHC94_03265 [Methylobacter sp.]|nr:hypothetical protein [Methylobacter sp.]